MDAKKELTVWDYVRSITITKEDLSLNNPNINGDKNYVQFLINRTLCYHLDSILIVEKVNRYNLNNLDHYHYLLKFISKKQRYYKAPKKLAIPEDVEIIQKLCNYSERVAMDTYSMLNDDDLETLRKLFNETKSNSSELETT